MKTKRLNRILGITLAITLPLTIILFIAATAMSVSGVGLVPRETQVLSEQYANVETLNISNMIDEIEVVATDTKEVSVEYSGEHKITIDYSEATKALSIETKENIVWFNFNFKFFNNMENGKLVVTVPKELKSLTTKGGIGNTKVTGLSVEKLSIEMGVGNVALETIAVKDTASMRGGVGNLTVKDFSATTLDIRGGVGNLNLDKISISDITTLNSGIGNTSITNSVLNTLNGSMGIGDLNLRGTEIQHNNISSGLGSVNF